MFQLEDRVLGCIDRCLCELGWVVASLIYDGLHVQHRNDACLTDALRAAEDTVKQELGFTIALLEKPLYDPEGGANHLDDDADPAGDAAYGDVDA